MLHCGKNRGANGMQHRRAADARFPPEMLASWRVIRFKLSKLC